MSGPLFAFDPYCEASKTRSHVELVHGILKKSRLDTGTGAEVAVTTTQATVAWPVASESAHALSLRFNALYTILDFDSITPMSNGHLHTLGLSLTGSHDNNGVEIMYRVTPAISVSSNALKNPELMNSESLQLNTSLIYKNEFHRQRSWVFGLMSDYRFGDYRLYPLAGVCWQPVQGWLLQLALPDFSIRKTFSNGINLTLYAAPEGNQWRVFSKDRQDNSALAYTAIVTGITAQWSITPALELSLDIEKQTRTEFSIVLDDNSLIEPNAEPALEFRLRGKFLF